MRFHAIKKDDMLNGSGLRAVVFVSGCDHKCPGCHNPETWDAKSGEEFTEESKTYLYSILDKEYISGVTFSGGDPLNKANIKDMKNLILDIRDKFPNKNIWIYTGYYMQELISDPMLKEELELAFMCDVLVDGRFVQSRADVNYQWAGSTNQIVIDINKTIANKRLILWDEK